MCARATTPPPSTSDRAIDALYAVPLDRFVEARNALAAELRRAGDAASAAAVKALVRPSISAWAINQVYWHARADYDRLVAAGEGLRRLQQDALSGRGGDPRGATAERQEAARAVVERAVHALAAHGPVTDAMRQRIAVTVDALAAWGGHPPDYTPGRLTRDLDPPGFAALASLGAPAAGAPRGKTPPAAKGPATPPSESQPLRLVHGAATGRESRPDPKGDAARAREAEQAARRAAREREAAERRERARREAALRDAARRVETAEAALARAKEDERARAKDHRAHEQQAEKLRRQLATAEQAQADAARALEHAAEASREATAALDQAREELRRARDAG